MKKRAYDGFPLIIETETDGFIYGEITDHLHYDDDVGCLTGDGFVQAPDGSRAGVIWQVEDIVSVSVCREPEEDRWGVYNVWFDRPIKTTADIVHNFRKVLPLLKEAYRAATGKKD
ncbi:3-deoxy-8-phosphooctulonate synthase [Paenibacillus alvei]|uniref:3-deoxy-8-phosphooctulonate synthase n=1 Tax=Paenibacillus alvei TaxID=44250 RepID=UPI0018CD58BE|nr:3-deoxy-8-phosphooctulonate synthase [Paenibacillus alvei]MBG9736735.1 3-deoxy-8-phosphooctulonate synthase [Paenibacillus alvei]MBG9745872.1 3-deoxy-8-phosphooctulonate synthase [Paenibacillus alvei]MCY9583017.1 3-deoxy-8-phosphooctulonate synthase [Paenibacillus alvei]MCY9588260.1 3-deoxy-8-phosphooctulonate synthase [Paenibacillus alvei]